MASKAFKFRKYPSRCLGAFAYRLNNRFDMLAMLRGPLSPVAIGSHVRERATRRMAELRD